MAKHLDNVGAIHPRKNQLQNPYVKKHPFIHDLP